MAFYEPAKALLQEEFGTAPLVVIKDPRICRLFPFWQEVMQSSGIDVVVACPIRHPVEAAQSLHARSGMPLAQGILLWIGHVLQAEYDSRGYRRSFTRFDDLLTAPVETLLGVQERTGLRFPHPPERKRQDLKEFLSPKQRHHKTERAGALPAPISTIYDILVRWAEDGEDAADYPVLDQVRASLHAVLSAVGDSWTLLSALQWIGAAEPPTPEKLTALPPEELAMLARVLIGTAHYMRGEIRERDGSLAAMAGKLRALRADLENRDRQIEDATNQRQVLERRSNALLQQMTGMCSAAELAAAQESAAAYECEIAEIKQHKAIIEGERDALLNSTIWRATAPLRRVVNALKPTIPND